MHLLPRAPRLGLLALLLALVAPACDVETEEEEGTEAEEASLTELKPERDDALAAVPWTLLGAGVHHKAHGEGHDALIVYGGYTAQDVYSQRWASELVRDHLGSRGVGEIYAVKGPDQSAYANLEIANSKLVRHLVEASVAERAARIVVVAHSSGTFVAAELFRMLRAGTSGIDPATLAKVAFFNLDGGGLDATTAAELGSAHFVYACDADIGRCSHNAANMKSEGARHASRGGAFEVDATGSGCDAHARGGLWCLHDAMITTLPHDPVKYDLRQDYTDFVTQGRAVVTSYLDLLDR